MSDETQTVEEPMEAPVEARAAGMIRIGLTIAEGDYRRLSGIALARWRRRYVNRVLPDGAVAELIARMVQRALEDVDRSDEERRVCSANARHVAAVPEPWPTGPWSQEEIDEVVTAAHAGETLDAIVRSVRRQRAEVVQLLRGFGLRVPRELRRRPAAGETSPSVEAVAR